MNRELINDEVRALARLDLEGLRGVWRDRYGSVPKLRSPELLALMLAWRIQAEAFGGLDTATRRKLRSEDVQAKDRFEVPIGTVLTREWQGVAETVRRTSAGYEWRGRTLRSLSAAAKAISGSPRSGPLFFGLKAAAS